MNKRNVTKLGVFRDILETEKSKSKVEQFLNQPEVSEESLRKKQWDLDKTYDENNPEAFDRHADEQIEIQLMSHRELQEAKELYLKLFNHILEDLEVLAELEQTIIQRRGIVNYDDDSSKLLMYTVSNHKYIYAKTHFYDAGNDSTDLRTIVCKMDEYGLETIEDAYANKKVRQLAKSKVIDWMMMHTDGYSTPIKEIKEYFKKKNIPWE